MCGELKLGKQLAHVGDMQVLRTGSVIQFDATFWLLDLERLMVLLLGAMRTGRARRTRML